MSLVAALVERLRLRRLRCGHDVTVHGRLWVHGSGQVQVGDETRFDGGNVGIELNLGDHSRIIIGPRCVLGEGVSIEARELVQIGTHVIVGAGTKILDNHFHPLRGDRDQQPPSQPVVIDDDVIIGACAIVLPGVHIERGARVADSAVVTRRVGPGAMVAGNPAKPVRPM